MIRSDKALAYFAFITVCLVWGTTYLGIRIAIESLPTFLFAGMRFTIAGAILLAICAMRGERMPRGLREWGNLSFIGLLMVGVGNLAVVYAEHSISSGFAALLVATSPFWMASLEALRKEGERLTARKLAGMIIGFSGVAVLVAPEVAPGSFNRAFLLGVIAIQLGSIGWDYGSIRAKYHPVAVSPLVSAGAQMLTGGLVVTIIGSFAGEWPRFVFTTRTFLAFSYLVVFGSILAYGAYVYALSKLRTSTVALYAYVNPAIAVVLGRAILNEPLGVRAIGAMTIILCGVALVQSGKSVEKLERVVEIEGGATVEAA